MEDLTLALITLTSFVLLFVVAIFADRAGAEVDDAANASDGVRVQVEETSPSVSARATSHADVA